MKAVNTSMSECIDGAAVRCTLPWCPHCNKKYPVSVHGPEEDHSDHTHGAIEPWLIANGLSMESTLLEVVRYCDEHEIPLRICLQKVGSGNSATL